MQEHIDLLARAGGAGAEVILEREWGVIADRWLGDLLVANPPRGDVEAERARNAGGGWHPLLGGHGDLRRRRGATRRRGPDDRLIEQLGIYGRELREELDQRGGLSAVPWTGSGFDALSDVLEANLHLDRARVEGMARLTAREPGGVIANLATLLLAARANDPRRYAELCGSLGLSAMIPANPILPAAWLAIVLSGFRDRGLVAPRWGGHVPVRAALVSSALIVAVVSLGPLGLLAAAPLAYLIGWASRRLPAELARRQGLNALAAMRGEFGDARPAAPLPWPPTLNLVSLPQST